ncbi:MAG TPA: TonB-dependent receptor plug domain-containing protein, partial [Opitutaceae bacterium]
MLSLPGAGFGQEEFPSVSESTEEVIELTPFEVTDADEGAYGTANTNAITGTNMPLSKVPVDASVFTRGLMDDLAVVDMGEMLVKIAGFGRPLTGSGEGTRGNEEGDATDFKNFTVRGLPASNQRRDGFIRSDATTLDGFDIEAVEVIKGSQSLLYGASDAGGVINFVAKRAALNQNKFKYKIKTDSEGSLRHEVDANVGDKYFAIRTTAVKDDTYFWKRILDRHHKGYFLTSTFRPIKQLTFRAEYRNFERSEINGTGGTIRAPADLLTSTGEKVDGQHTKQLLFKGEGDVVGF